MGTSMANCFTRHITELGAASLWRGNVANCIRYVPTAAFNLAFKDNIKKLFPKYSKDKEFGKFAMSQVASGAAAGGVTNTLVYPLIYIRTVLGADLGKVKKYNSMLDCMQKTIKENGFFSLYNGIGPSSCGIVVYRGAQFGVQDIPRRSTRTKKKRLPLLCSPSSWSRSWLSASQASSHTHSTPCSVVCRSRRLNPKPSRSTAACKTVSRRSLRTKERRDSSRARWPTSCVALVQLSCSCCTTKL